METKPTIYTEEYVLAEVKKMLDELLADETIIYLGQLFYNKPYARYRFHEWANGFIDNQEISLTIRKIKEILESRAVVGGLNNKLSPVMTKFHLINNYDWKDKHELGGTDGQPIQIMQYVANNPLAVSAAPVPTGIPPNAEEV